MIVMVTLSDIKNQRVEIIRLAEKHGAHDVRVFGSVVRGDASDRSDLDILVRLDDDRSLIDHVALIRDMEHLLHSKVDVVPEQALHAAIRDDVLREAVEI